MLYSEITSVHIVAQRANRYIVAFHIAISNDLYMIRRWPVGVIVSSLLSRRYVDCTDY